MIWYDMIYDMIYRYTGSPLGVLQNPFTNIYSWGQTDEGLRKSAGATHMLRRNLVANRKCPQLESVLGYNFGHNKQLAFGWLFIISFYTVLTSPNKDETAVYG